jgi:hypothetical protein
LHKKNISSIEGGARAGEVKIKEPKSDYFKRVGVRNLFLRRLNRVFSFRGAGSDAISRVLEELHPADWKESKFPSTTGEFSAFE